MEENYRVVFSFEDAHAVDVDYGDYRLLEDLTMHNPARPAKVLLDPYLKPIGVSITAAADAFGVTPKHVSEIVNGRRSGR